ncbi:MAG: hypothetical protein IKR33_00825 [Bacteroidales bacterium]|nr:hypothetical protein [Bacteroidales bacterium]
MKTNRILRILLAVLIAALAVEVAYCFNLWNIRGVKPSEVYNRYKDVPGVNAAYIKDYRVGDSVTVSVTLLEASDSASWAGLKQDFNVVDTLPMVVEMIESGVLKKKMRLAPKRDYRLPKDSVFSNNDLIVATYKSHTICIFHLDNREQSLALYGKQLDEIKPKF